MLAVWPHENIWKETEHRVDNLASDHKESVLQTVVQQSFELREANLAPLERWAGFNGMLALAKWGSVAIVQEGWLVHRPNPSLINLIKQTN